MQHRQPRRLHGVRRMITRLETTPVPPTAYPEAGPWRMSHTLWNHQQAFDTRLHEERRLRYPRDAAGDSVDESRREWVLGQSFALLEELGELLEAKENENPDEETVDTLHFVLSLAEKLGMTPADLGRFEDRFHAARDVAGDGTWDEVLLAVLPDYVMAVSALKGAHFKWWKNQPTRPDWTPQREALRRIDHLNLMVASRVFDDAQAMFDAYVGKVAQNHARQQGLVAGRETYQV